MAWGYYEEGLEEPRGVCRLQAAPDLTWNGSSHAAPWPWQGGGGSLASWLEEQQGEEGDPVHNRDRTVRSEELFVKGTFAAAVDLVKYWAKSGSLIMAS